MNGSGSIIIVNILYHNTTNSKDSWKEVRKRNFVNLSLDIILYSRRWFDIHSIKNNDCNNNDNDRKYHFLWSGITLVENLNPFEWQSNGSLEDIWIWILKRIGKYGLLVCYWSEKRLSWCKNWVKDLSISLSFKRGLSEKMLKLWLDKCLLLWFWKPLPSSGISPALSFSFFMNRLIISLFLCLRFDNSLCGVIGARLSC